MYKRQGESGTAELGTNRPVSANARFRVGSITKVFTAAVVLQLAAEHKVELDQPVQRYLPGVLPARYPDITVGQLLNHTSGLPSPDLYTGLPDQLAHRFSVLTPQRYVELLSRKDMLFTPGTQQHYSNSGYFLAGMLIEKVTGHSYEQEVSRRIFQPLGLRQTSAPGNDPFIWGVHNHGYQTVTDESGTRLVDVTVFNQSDTWAAGEIISTTADLEKFTTALFSGKVVPRPLLKNMFTVPVHPVTHQPLHAYDGDDDPTTGKAAVHSMGMSKMELAPGLVAWGKSGARLGYSAAIGATEDLSRILVYSLNSTNAKAEGQNQLGLKVITAAFAG